MLKKLSNSLKETLRKITKAGHVDAKLVKEITSDIKKALIQGDVSVKLAQEISKSIESRAKKEKPAAGLTPREHTVNIVYEELTKFLGAEHVPLKIDKKPTIVLLVGLFGSGKTTATAKLAKHYKRAGLKVAVMQTDTWRPAAYEQLSQLTKKLKIPLYGKEKAKDPLKIIKEAKKSFKKHDIIIVDSAGRDALNKELISEIKKLNKELKAHEKILVLSGDIGQGAEDQAKAFKEAIGVTGVIVTKLDGTAKGGGALTACYVTDSPVKFISVGERLDDIEEYKPKNFVSRLLGMGDLETLLQKAETAISKEQAEKMGKKLQKGDFNLTDLYEQMGSVKKMGSMSQLASLIPGLAGMNLPTQMLEGQEKKMGVWKFTIDSMTPKERENPDLIIASRIKRIAKGSGRGEKDVRELLKQFKQMKKMMKMVSDPRKMKQMAKLMGKGGMKMPGLGF